MFWAIFAFIEESTAKNRQVMREREKGRHKAKEPRV